MLKMLEKERLIIGVWFSRTEATGAPEHTQKLKLSFMELYVSGSVLNDRNLLS